MCHINYRFIDVEVEPLNLICYIYKYHVYILLTSPFLPFFLNTDINIVRPRFLKNL